MADLPVQPGIRDLPHHPRVRIWPNTLLVDGVQRQVEQLLVVEGLQALATHLSSKPQAKHLKH